MTPTKLEQMKRMVHEVTKMLVGLTLTILEQMKSMVREVTRWRMGRNRVKCVGTC